MLSRWCTSRRVQLATYSHLMPSLRMLDPIPTLTPYTVMLYIQTNLPSLESFTPIMQLQFNP